MTSITLRLATPADAAFLAELYRDVHAPEFQPLGLPAPALAQLLSMQCRAQQSGYAQQHPHALDHLIEQDRQPIGRLLLETQPDRLLLVDFTLLAPARGQGIGAFLLRLLAAQADARGLPVRLGVRPQNPAQALYRRHGFATIGDDGANLTLERPPAASANPHESGWQPVQLATP